MTFGQPLVGGIQDYGNMSAPAQSAGPSLAPSLTQQAPQYGAFGMAPGKGYGRDDRFSIMPIPGLMQRGSRVNMMSNTPLRDMMVMPQQRYYPAPLASGFFNTRAYGTPLSQAPSVSEMGINEFRQAAETPEYRGMSIADWLNERFRNSTQRPDLNASDHM